ncbi:MAG TPA: hypothetical protein VI894_00860 [Candidatus Nanoarchaeia archaeon]|nr:hypothetical protein [Candidatus Nanoarchaeia archaeon]
MQIGKLTALNSKESSDMLERIAGHWNIESGFVRKIKNSYFFLKNRDNRVFAVSRKIAELELGHLKINSIGLYVAEVHNNFVRLSVEGSQMFGGEAKANVVGLDDDEIRRWIVGEDVERKSRVGKEFVIIKNANDFFGCGKITEEKIINYFPKQRRLEEIS